MDEALLTKPAKDLTDAEAFDVLMYLYESDEVKLPDGVKLDPKDPDKILAPKPGAKLPVGTTMGDVTFRLEDDKTRPKGGAMAGNASLAFNPTPAFAVLLYRLAAVLHEKWNVTTIVCGGVGSGRTQTDCHALGRCVDFYGVVRAGGETIDVQRDWFARPVPMSVLDEDGKPETFTPNRTAEGDLDNWGGEAHTYFRLAYSAESRDATPRDFFASVYEFAARESTTGSQDVSAANFRRGVPLGTGIIFHPDYPVLGATGAWGQAGRMSHHDHVHFQLGVKSY